MSPPTARPFPRFVADSTQEKQPYGRWEERLLETLADRCEALAEEAGAPLEKENVRWFPERAYGGRVYVPATSRTVTDEGGSVEYFGHISFVRPDEGEPTDLRAEADFTDVTADDNPEWKIDLNDDVIGAWRADGARGGDVTLVWGVPLVRGAFAATAEMDGEVLDQTAVEEGRFTIVAVDAVTGFGDDLYMKIHLWDKRLRPVAAESLYDEAEGGEAEPDPETGEEPEPDPEAESDDEPEATPTGSRG